MLDIYYFPILFGVNIFFHYVVFFVIKIGNTHLFLFPFKSRQQVKNSLLKGIYIMKSLLFLILPPIPNFCGTIVLTFYHFRNILCAYVNFIPVFLFFFGYTNVLLFHVITFMYLFLVPFWLLI